MKALAILPLLLLCSCTSLSIEDKQRQVAFHANLPAYPWQDGKQALKGMNLSARGTNLTVSLHGLSQEEATTSNFVYMVERIVGAAVKAAIEATVKP